MTGDSHIFFLGRTLIVLLILLCVTSLFSSSAAQDRPNLSEAIREVIDSQGVEAAKVHFTQMDPSERSQYSIDMEGISELTNSYLEDGNMDALIAISEISAPFMQDMASQAMEQYAPQMEKMEEMAGEREAEEEQAARQREQERVREHQKSIVERQGQPRDDLERFKGVYGDPESTRQLWVSVSCDGYLVSGAMWGDAAPWWLRAETDNVFTLEDSFNNIRMEFGSSGGNTQMTHNLEFIENPLQHVGPLPKEWNSCIERYQ